jgi:tetratricopeptide (TPR) repeat protein
MKKIVFATVMALASMGLVVPMLHAQEQGGSISIKDPAEYNAYMMATSQSDPKAKAAALEQFLTQYPQSVVKSVVLDTLIGTYQQLQSPDQTLSAASRLLQIDPNNMKAIFISVFIKKSECAKSVDATGKSKDPQTCDDAAALAQKGLQVAKPAAVSADDWSKQTAATYPLFHSAIALDDTVVKKDYKDAQAEYTQELKLYSDDDSKRAGLSDTLLLAQAYSQPGSTQDLIKAVWFYARVWNFAPANYKSQIEPKLEYWYKKYHGGLDGLDAIKQQAATSLFPPGTFAITPAKSPQEQIHDLIANTPDLTTLALADKETILAYGSKDDADKLWALLQGKETPVPGIVISVNPDGTQISVAVTQDAKDSKTADFIVNLKEPLKKAELDLYQPGFEFKTQPAAELDGTYDTYTQKPATDTTSASAQIVLKDAFIQPEKKKAPAHKPAASHRKGRSK